MPRTFLKGAVSVRVRARDIRWNRALVISMLSLFACSSVPIYRLAGDEPFDASTQDAAPTVTEDGSIPSRDSGIPDAGSDGPRDAGYRYQVFVTSTPYAGTALGGVLGADQKCQTAGATFKPGATWKAFIAESDTKGPETRVPGSRPYYRVVPPGAPDVMVLATTNLPALNSVLNSELGTPAGTAVTWIGDNEPSPKGRCGDWAGLDGGSSTTTTGLATSQSDWRSNAPRGCTELAALYCFEVQ